MIDLMRLNVLGPRPYVRVALLLLLSSSLLVSLSAAEGGLTTELCNLIDTLKGMVFVVALALAVLGGALYAIAHMLPAQQRGALQGYGMGMIIGGVLGVILVLLAPSILELVARIAGASNTMLTGNTCAGAIPFGGT